MSEKPFADFSAVSPLEAIMGVPGLCYERLKKYPIKCRTSYQTVSWVMLAGKDSKWVEFFEDEKSTFLMITTPAGRVQVYFDHALAPGESYFEFRDNDPAPVKVLLAY